MSVHIFNMILLVFHHLSKKFNFQLHQMEYFKVTNACDTNKIFFRNQLEFKYNNYTEKNVINLPPKEISVFKCGQKYKLGFAFFIQY